MGQTWRSKGWGHFFLVTCGLLSDRCVVASPCSVSQTLWACPDSRVRAVSDFTFHEQRMCLSVIYVETCLIVVLSAGAVYDSGCGLVMSAECEPYKLLVGVDEGQGGQFLDAEQHGRVSDPKNEVILKVWFFLNKNAWCCCEDAPSDVNE